MLSLLAPTAFAANTELTVKTPATIPRAGETFSVTVDVTGNPGLCSVQFTLAYDKNLMTCTKVVEGAILDGMLSVTNANARDGAIVAAASAEPSAGDGVLAEFTFTANRDLADYGFRLEEIALSNAYGEDIPFTVTGAELVELGTPAAPAQPTPTPSMPAATEQPKLEQTPAATEQAAAETAVETRFSDTAGHWGAEWIAKAAERGLFAGYPDGGFHPDAQISRGDYVLVLYRMAGEPEVTEMAPFADVNPNDYYAKAVSWAYSKGYVDGKGDGFAPKDSLTRQEAMKILYGYAGSPMGMEAMFTGIYDEAFDDSAEIATWAKPAMYWAVYNTILNGMDGGLNPAGTATRAQLAKILVEYQNNSAS